MENLTTKNEENKSKVSHVQKGRRKEFVFVDLRLNGARILVIANTREQARFTVAKPSSTVHLYTYHSY